MRQVLLTDICRPTQWKTISATDLKETGYPVFGANGIIGFYDTYTHEVPTVLITCRGATCGKINVSLPKSYVNGNAMALDSLTDNVDLLYLKFFLEQRGFQDVISGSAQPQITRQNLKKVKIPLPSLPVQKRIAEILDLADAYRQKTKALIDKYDELAQSIFLEMFGDPVTNPKGWEEVAINDACETLRDGPFGSNLKSEHYVNEGIRVVRLQNIGVGRFFNDDKAFISQEHSSELIRNQCFPGDILIGTMGEPNLRACQLPKTIGVAINKADCLLCRPNKETVNSTYFLGLLNNQSFVKSVSNLILGQTRGRISKGRLSTKKIILPPLELQLKFEKILLNLQGQVQYSEEASSKADDVFKSLLQKAFKGELVTQTDLESIKELNSHA